MEKHSKTFYLKNGNSFSTLKGLAKELKNMNDEIFTHHVNLDKNDFANWALNSLNKEQLYIKIEKLISKLEIELEVLRHLVHEENGPKKTKKSATENKKTVKVINKTKK